MSFKKLLIQKFNRGGINFMSALKKKADCNLEKDCDTKPIFLFCGRGVNTTFFGLETSALVPTPSSARIAEVTVDARGLEKPVVEIEFSSIINALPNGGNAKASLSFFLFRSCDDDKPVLLNSWPYEAFNVEVLFDRIRLSTSFVFNFCECLSTSGCFKYFVEVFSGELFRASAAVNNIQIAALVGEAGC